MTTPKVSVLTTAFRPGGIDILLAGLRDQTFKDFEVILADRRYERRHDRVMALAAEYGVPLVHIPEHRRNGKWTSFCAGWNSAMALARGEITIFLQEWAYAPSGWIAAHVRAHAKQPRPSYILAPYAYTKMPALRLLKPFDFTGQRQRGDRCVEPDAILSGGVLDEIEAFEEGRFAPSMTKKLALYGWPDQDTRAAMAGARVADTWVHIKNESMNRELLWSMCGLDERLERGKGPMDLDFGARLTNGKVPLVWAPDALCIVPDPRWICRTMPWGDMKERLEGRWSYNDGLLYNERVKRSGSTVAANPYTMAELAARLESWRDPANHPVQWIEATDFEYWGREIWPESP